MRRGALAALAAGLVVTGSAGASVADAGAKSFAGIVPDVATGAHVHRIATAHAAELPYLGGPVLHSNRTHVIFWQPAGSGLAFDPGYVQSIERFLHDVAADSHHSTNVYGLSGQYRDGEGIAAYDSTYGGAVVATDPLPHSGCTEPPAGIGPGWADCVNDGQLEDELARVVRTDGLPVTNHDIYFIVTPAGLGSCEFKGPDECALGGPESGYCGYHSVGPNRLLYAVIPYNAVFGHCQSGNPRPNDSTADPTLSTISHEQNETVTDPLGTSWVRVDGEEMADVCVTSFGPAIGGFGTASYNQLIDGHRYELQEEWSNAAHGCAQRPRPDVVSFGARRHPTAGSPVRFFARARDPQSRIVSFSWSFGSTGRRASHTFRRPGRYSVRLRTTNSWGNWTFASRTIDVAPR